MTDTRITRSCEYSSEDGSNIMNVTVLKLDDEMQQSQKLVCLACIEIYNPSITGSELLSVNNIGDPSKLKFKVAASALRE